MLVIIMQQRVIGAECNVSKICGNCQSKKEMDIWMIRLDQVQLKSFAESF